MGGKIPGWTALWVLGWVLPAAAAGETVERRYPLFQRGFLKLRVPGSWQEEVRRSDQRLPPAVVLKGEDPGGFAVLLTPIWPPGKEAPSPDRDLRRQVEMAADRAKPQAVEENLPLREMEGSAGRGYFFSATDRAPKPGEYRYLTQGILRVGELTLTFTILTHEGGEGAVRKALLMLQGAVHLRGS